MIGQTVSHYRVLEKLGGGGMGVVYKAEDTKLGRFVALKFLPESMLQDRQSLERFQREARAASALNHPNICTIYEVGEHNGQPFLAMELLDGTTLRHRIAEKRLPFDQVLELGIQIADALDAAHAQGIVHRDIKPANIFVTKRGQSKVLDFGLAKLAPKPSAGEAHSDSAMPTAAVIGVTDELLTSPGSALGTVAYMSPEQARGEELDARTDLFSFGVVLYEMATGQQAFSGNTSAIIFEAILNRVPPPTRSLNPQLPAEMDHILGKALEKDRELRCQTAAELRADLKRLKRDTESSRAAPKMAEERPTAPAVSSGAAASAPPLRSYKWLTVAAAAVIVVAVAAFFAGERMRGPLPPAAYHQLSFRRGTIRAARFAPDGQSVVYGALWEGSPIDIFITRPESPQSRSLGFSGSELLAISSTGEMAVSVGSRPHGADVQIGTLARASLNGGAPRQILEDVQWADWSPDGSNLAVVRDVAGRNQLEFPIGKVLYESSGWIGHPRISPKGDRIAFMDHPLLGDDSGTVAVIDLAGNRKLLASNFVTLQGLAWARSGDEVWFTGSRTGATRAVYAVTLTGAERLVTRVPGTLMLLDIARDGRVLVTRENLRREMIGLSSGEAKESDISWLDYSYPADLSSDGKTLLFDEEGEGGGSTYAVYLRRGDEPIVRLGEGQAVAVSPDGKWAMSSPLGAPAQLVLLPTGPGETKALTHDSINHNWARWLPDGKGVVFSGNEPGHGARFYVQDLAGAAPRAISPEGINPLVLILSPDGQTIAGVGPDEKGYLYALAGGEPKPIPSFSPGEEPIEWTADGRSLYVYRPGEMPARVYRLELASGKRSLWKQLIPADPAGVNRIGPIRLTPDGKWYVYGYHRILSDLFLAEGLK